MTGRRPTFRPSIRKAAICDFIEQRNQASVEELAEKFNTSPETIRRDLNFLADTGQIRKVHGGAKSATHKGESHFDERMKQNLRAKQIIAEKLVKSVSNGQTLFIDTGSTTLICAQALMQVKNLTVITNSVRIASTFASSKSGSKAYLLGGEYRNDNNQTVGPATLNEIGRYHVDQAIITIAALDEVRAMDYSNDEAQVARAMIKSADLVTLVVDSSKVNKKATFEVCELQGIDRLILDKAPDEKLIAALASAEVKVL